MISLNATYTACAIQHWVQLEVLIPWTIIQYKLSSFPLTDDTHSMITIFLSFTVFIQLSQSSSPLNSDLDIFFHNVVCLSLLQSASSHTTHGSSSEIFNLWACSFSTSYCCKTHPSFFFFNQYVLYFIICSKVSGTRHIRLISGILSNSTISIIRQMCYFRRYIIHMISKFNILYIMDLI